MKPNNDYRSLRLERLESRSLLAAGVLDFSIDQDRTDELLSLVDRSATPQQTSTPLPSQQNASPRPELTASQAAPLNANPIQPAAGLNRPIAVAPEGLPLLQRPDSPSRLAATDVAIASLFSTETSNDQGTDLVTENATTIEPTTQPSSLTSGPSFKHQADAFTHSANDPLAEDQEGFIELSPLTPLEASNDQENSWQLRRESLPLLQRIVEQESNQRSPDQRVDAIDQMMSERFSGSWTNANNALIALSHVQLPAVMFPVTPALIDVGLKPTVALHRSLGFVAESVSPALSGPVLDAIMASFDQVAASEIQPVAAVRTFQIPTAVYPTIAAMITGFVISSRRKFKHPESNLQATKPK